MEQNKILIVDDLIDNLKIMVSVFEEHLPDYTIYQTNNPQKALDIAVKTKPHLIITDWDMPQVSGITLIKKLKKHPDTKDIPVIMATGVMISTKDLKKAFEAGAIDYVRKPLDPIELIARTNSALLIRKYYNQILDQKDQSLAESSLYLVKKQEYNNYLLKELEEIKAEVEQNTVAAIPRLDALKTELIKNNDEESWYRFDLSFNQVHKGFVKHLTHKHPEITPAELKLCSFIRLGMANKEIASVLNQSPDSIKVSSYRIRKKIKLDGSVNLRSYLSQF